MSGLKGRAHLIRKYTYPPDLISASLFALADLYVQKGFDRQDAFSALQIKNTSTGPTDNIVWRQNGLLVWVTPCL